MEPYEKQTDVGDLIRELEGVALEFDSASLVVEFADHCQVVYNHDEQKLTKLDTLVKQGGNPIGFIGSLYPEDAPFQVFLRPLTKFGDDPAVKARLNEVVGLIAEEMTRVASVLVRMSKGATGPAN